MEVTQSLVQEEQVAQEGVNLNLSIEFVAYAALLLLAVVLRLAQVDVISMTNSQAQEALAAWRVVYPHAPGSAILSQSPLLFLLHSLSFTTLGASEFSARIGTILGSLVLVLTPLLFRSWLGRGRTFIFSLLLVFSPVLLIASRTDSPMIWTTLVGVLALWAFWRYYLTSRGHYGVLALTLAVSTVLLTDPTGFVFVLILLGAGVFTIWASRRNLAEAEDESLDDRYSTLRTGLRTLPWLNSLLVAALTVFIVGTLFMLYPAGLNAVSNLLGEGMSGLTTPLPDVLPFFPLLITLFYEPVLVVFAIAAIVWLVRRDSFTFVERFFTGWLIFGLVGSLIYAGAGAAQSLWLVVPMAGLASSVIAGLFMRAERPVWWGVPPWSRWVITLCGVFLLAMFAIHTQALGRALVNMPEGTFQFDKVNSGSLVLVLISVMSMIIGFFLAASLWGIEITTQGAAIALLAFGLVTSLGSGWRASVVTAENPVELWNRDAVSSETMLLRQTLNEIARRESRGYPQIPIVALAPQDGVIAWVLRDYVTTRFITDVHDAQAQEIALLPMYNEPPDLGGSYVGQTFHISETWSPGTIQLSGLLSWWIAGHNRISGTESNTMVLWLRQDIYDGVPASTSQGVG